METIDIAEIAANLAGIWYLATSEGDQAHVRPFDNCALLGGKIYVGTAKNKKVYAQIMNNPKVEIFAMTDFGPCRFMAYARPDEEKTEEVFQKMGKIRDENSIAIELSSIIEY